MKLLQRILISSFVVCCFAIHTSAQSNYKFSFIERLATEKYGGTRDMAMTRDGSIFIAGTATGELLPTLGPQIVDYKSLKPDSLGVSYIQKYDANGNLTYASYVNSCGAQKIYVVDEENIYITGHFSHNDCATEGAFRVPDPQGGAFLTKINLKDHKVVYSLSIGGKAGGTEAFGLVVTSAGEPVLAGYTESKSFPTTANAFQKSYDPAKEFEESGFICKFSADGSRLAASTFLHGASESTMVRELAVGKTDDVYLTGWTRAYKFPTTKTYGDFDEDSEAAFVTKLSSDLSKIVFSAKFRGGRAGGESITVGSDDTAYVSGSVYDNFFTTSGVFQPRMKGDDYNAFILSLTADGELKFSTLLGGKGDSSGGQILAAPDGRIILVGTTSSKNFPVTKDAYQGSYEGGIKRFDLGEHFKTAFYDHSPDDGFLAILSPGATSLLYSTYLGGTEVDSISSVGLDSSSNIYIVGHSASKRFPQLNPKTRYDRGDGTYFLGKLVP